jgi:hypothetical protein
MTTSTRAPTLVAARIAERTLVFVMSARAIGDDDRLGRLLTALKSLTPEDHRIPRGSSPGVTGEDRTAGEHPRGAGERGLFAAAANMSSYSQPGFASRVAVNEPDPDKSL